MNENLYQQDERGKNFLIKIVLIVMLFAAVIVIPLTNYKNETVVCDKAQDICYLQKTNLINMQKRKDLIKYSQIAGVTFIPRRVSGNRYAKGYSYYILAFNTKDNQNVQIFSTDYYDKDEVKNAVEKLKILLNNNENLIEYSR